MVIKSRHCVIKGYKKETDSYYDELLTYSSSLERINLFLILSLSNIAQNLAHQQVFYYLSDDKIWVLSKLKPLADDNTTLYLICQF